MKDLNLAEPRSKAAAESDRQFQMLYKMIVCESLLADLEVPAWVRNAGPHDNNRLSRYANNLTRQRLAASLDEANPTAETKLAA